MVVDKLPVPLHISAKQLSELASEEGNEALNSFLSENFKYKIAFDANSLPADYRSHPYWKKDGKIFLGMLPRDQHVELSTHLRTTMTVDESLSAQSVAPLLCAHCGVSQSGLKRCSRCNKVFYCSKEHQTADWTRHKHAECADADDIAAAFEPARPEGGPN